jgi:hypothetical protein
VSLKEELRSGFWVEQIPDKKNYLNFTLTYLQQQKNAIM